MDSDPLDEADKDDKEEVETGHGARLRLVCSSNSIRCVPYSMKEDTTKSPRKLRAYMDDESETPATQLSSKKLKMEEIDTLQIQHTLPFDSFPVLQPSNAHNPNMMENARLQCLTRSSMDSHLIAGKSQLKESNIQTSSCLDRTRSLTVTDEGRCGSSGNLTHKTLSGTHFPAHNCSQTFAVCCNLPPKEYVESNLESELRLSLKREIDKAAAEPIFSPKHQLDVSVLESTANLLCEKGALLAAEQLYPLVGTSLSMPSDNGKNYEAGEKLLPILTSPSSLEELLETRKSLSCKSEPFLRTALADSEKRHDLFVDGGDVINKLRRLDNLKLTQNPSLNSSTLHQECERLEAISSRANLDNITKCSLQLPGFVKDTKNLRHVQNLGFDIRKKSFALEWKNGETITEDALRDVALHSAQKNLYMDHCSPADSSNSQLVNDAHGNDLSTSKLEKSSLLRHRLNDESTIQEDSCSGIDAHTDTSNCHSDADNGSGNSTLCSLKHGLPSYSTAVLPILKFSKSLVSGVSKTPSEKCMKIKESEGNMRYNLSPLQEKHVDVGCNLSSVVPLRDDPDTPIDSEISYNSQQIENLLPYQKLTSGNKDTCCRCLASENKHNCIEVTLGKMDSSMSSEFEISGKFSSKESVQASKTCQYLSDSVKEKKKRLMISAQLHKKGPPTSAKTLLATGLLEGKYVRYMARGGEVLRLGVVKDGGILCQCTDCKGQQVFNVSGFEKHAGSNARHPSDYIFLGNGKSLKEIIEAGIKVKDTGDILFAVQEAIDEGADRQVCSKCDEGGAILRCANKSCSRLYHQGCIGLNIFPEGRWLCPECSQSDVYEPLSERSSLQRRSVHHPESGFQLKPRDPSLHKALFLPGGLPDGTQLGYYDKGQCLLVGSKEGSGICCSCCNQVVSCSQFEVHAGWGARRNPYNCIRLSDGRSLHDVAVQSWNIKSSTDYDDSLTSATNHDHCLKCGLDGAVVQCHVCSRAYHPDCAGLRDVPDTNWSCLQCISRKLVRLPKTSSSSSMANDWVQGRCKRVVKAPEVIASGCALCKCGDFTKSGFDARTVLLCDQCEREFHVGCLKVHGLADLEELPQGEWFCGKDCQHIHEMLQLLVLNGPQTVPESIASKVIKKLQGAQSESAESMTFNLTWQILHGKTNCAKQAAVLADVMEIFSECFDPIVDAVSGQDLIPLLLYSQTKGEQEYGGMHCIVLKCNEEVLSAAIVRIFGKQLAEMPLLATRLKRRSLGACRALLQCVERLLGILQVETISVPAAEGAEDIWLNKFGFSQMPHKQFQEYMSQLQMMVFSGSYVVQKAIPSLPGFPECTHLQ